MPTNNFEGLKKRKSPAFGKGAQATRKLTNTKNIIIKIAATTGNLGVQMMRFSKNGITEFTTISYWANNCRAFVSFLNQPPKVRR